MNARGRSAGLTPSKPGPSEGTLQVARERGLDLSRHRPQVLSDSLVKDAPLVLTMTGAQKATVLRRFPWAKRQCFTLLEFTGDDGDINEPVGGGAGGLPAMRAAH